MPATGHKGIDVRQTGSRLIFRASLKDSVGARVTTGTANVSIYELQDDGTLKTYDFADNTFKATAVTTENASMTHRTGNNSTSNTGIWTYVLSTVSGFTAGALYFSIVNHASASPPQQEREFQYGSEQGDITVTSTGTGTASIDADLSASERSSIADAFLGRNLAGGSDGGRTVQDTLRVGRNKVTIDGSTITVYKEDDVTIAWQGTVTRAQLDSLQTIDPS